MAAGLAGAALVLSAALAGCSKEPTAQGAANAQPANAPPGAAAPATPGNVAAAGAPTPGGMAPGDTAPGSATGRSAPAGSLPAGSAPGSGDTAGGRVASGAANAARPALTVTVTTPRTEPLRRTLPATGAVAAWQEIVVAPEVGGYLVASVLADVGSVVKKGQTLATLRGDLLGADMASRRAAREQARAALENAQSVLRRAETLKDTGAISDEELDRLRTEVLTARARLQSAQADLSTAQLRLNKARIVAPDAGTITARSVTVGQVAQPTNEMFRLMRQDRLEWRAEVPEVRLREVRPGQPVQMRAADGTRFSGRVRTVAPTVKAEDRNALVYVDVAAGAAVRPGQFATGEFDLGSVSASTVPLGALVTQDGMQYVFVVGADERVHRRRIEIGASQGDRIEVTVGLQADDRVVVQGAGYLRDGDRVAIAAAPEPADKAPAPVATAPAPVAAEASSPAAAPPAAAPAPIEQAGATSPQLPRADAQPSPPAARAEATR